MGRRLGYCRGVRGRSSRQFRVRRRDRGARRGACPRRRRATADDGPAVIGRATALPLPAGGLGRAGDAAPADRPAGTARAAGPIELADLGALFRVIVAAGSRVPRRGARLRPPGPRRRGVRARAGASRVSPGVAAPERRRAPPPPPPAACASIDGAIAPREGRQAHLSIRRWFASSSARPSTSASARTRRSPTPASRCGSPRAGAGWRGRRGPPRCCPSTPPSAAFACRVAPPRRRRVRLRLARATLRRRRNRPLRRAGARRPRWCRSGRSTSRHTGRQYGAELGLRAALGARLVTRARLAAFAALQAELVPSPVSNLRPPARRGRQTTCGLARRRRRRLGGVAMGNPGRLGALVTLVTLATGCGSELDVGSDLIWTARFETATSTEYTACRAEARTLSPSTASVWASDERAHTGRSAPS